MRVVLQKMEELWKEDKERIAKEMGDAIFKGEFSNWGLEFIEKAASELREADPELSLGDSFAEVMETELGSGIYKMLNTVGKAERQSKPAPLSKVEQPDPFGGVVGEEVRERIKLLRMSESLSDSQALEKVFTADPDLYQRYLREITASTAVG